MEDLASLHWWYYRRFILGRPTFTGPWKDFIPARDKTYSLSIGESHLHIYTQATRSFCYLCGNKVEAWFLFLFFGNGMAIAHLWLWDFFDPQLFEDTQRLLNNSSVLTMSANSVRVMRVVQTIRRPLYVPVYNIPGYMNACFYLLLRSAACPWGILYTSFHCVGEVGRFVVHRMWPVYNIPGYTNASFATCPWDFLYILPSTVLEKLGLLWAHLWLFSQICPISRSKSTLDKWD